MKKNTFYNLFTTIFLLTTTPVLNADNPVYHEVAIEVGLNHKVDFPLSPVIQGFGGGAVWVDIDNDGDDDVAFSNPHGFPISSSYSWLYRNNGNGTFTDITSAAFGLEGFGKGKCSMGIIAADYNGDGFDDILLLNGSGSSIGEDADQNQLYQNKGNGTFVDVTLQAGIMETGIARWSFAGAFADIDNDSDLDLYIGNYVAINRESECSENYFYRNNGDGTFIDEAELLGVNNTGCTLATAFSDVDNDGDLDLWVINDFGKSFNPNELYRNDGLDETGNPIFIKAAASMNLDAAIFGMGVAIGDINNNGLTDYYVTNIGANLLHKNSGNGTFSDIALSAGVADEFIDGTTVLSSGWGTAFLDMDNDGLQDIYVANGWIGVVSKGLLTHNPNRLYMNNGDETFSDVTTLLGNDVISDSFDRGLAVADYDNDGDMDMLVLSTGRKFNAITGGNAINAQSMPKLLRNDTNNGANWLKLNLKGNKNNHRAIGAKVRIKSVTDTSSIRNQYREIHAGSSHASGNEVQPHFGLGYHLYVLDLDVTWPNGCRSSVSDPGINQIITIEESTCE